MRLPAGEVGRERSHNYQPFLEECLTSVSLHYQIKVLADKFVDRTDTISVREDVIIAGFARPTFAKASAGKPGLADTQQYH